jgi:DNA-binding NarL/FixJ family response regulator
MLGKGSKRASVRLERAATPAADLVPVHVMLADSQAIFRMGIGKVLAAEPGIAVVNQAESLGEALAALAATHADVLLLEAALSPTPSETISDLLKRFPSLGLVLLLNASPSEAETLEYLRRGVHGLVTRAIAPELLGRCLRKVFEGEYWIGHDAVGWVLKAFRDQAVQLRSTEPRRRLSEKELLIISGVTQGLRNKDIARKIGTSEQVIKNYLRKIYEKLGISDRLELALYTVHKRLLDASSPDSEAPADSTLTALVNTGDPTANGKRSPATTGSTTSPPPPVSK